MKQSEEKRKKNEEKRRKAKKKKKNEEKRRQMKKTKNNEEQRRNKQNEKRGRKPSDPIYQENPRVIKISIIVNPRWGGCAVNPKIVQKSRNKLLKTSFREVSASFREVSAYFRGVSAYFRGVSAYFRPWCWPPGSWKAPWRSSQSCVTGDQQPIGNP